MPLHWQTRIIDFQWNLPNFVSRAPLNSGKAGITEAIEKHYNPR